MTAKELIGTLKANGMSGDELVQEFLGEMRTEHRTNQASVIRTMQAILVGYSESNSDMRNEAAVEFAQEVKKIETRIPFI